LFIKIKSKTFNKILQSDKFGNDLLMKKIIDFFTENQLHFDDISSIFVNQGPGNFSGLRGSLAIAKGISLSKNINLFGYDTFIWSCAKFIDKKKSICCITKFREKYYIKNFDTNFKGVQKIEESSKDNIIKKYTDKLKVVPINVSQQFDQEILKLKNIKIVNLDHNDLEFLQLKGLLDEGLIKPLYLS
tara:strand:- start:342 stop:905 length:564 start_codon:yes stop_codon:yes gene_type:complete